MKMHPLAMCMVAMALAGCSTVKPPPTVPHVDLERFMGDWYVQGGLLTSFEKGAHNAVENYRLDEDGRIPTTYTFRKGSFDGPLKTYTSTAFVHDRTTFAEWRIQFIWPFKAPYLIVHLDPDYSLTAVSSDDKEYLWIMSREPHPDDARYQAVVDRLGDLGFATNRFVRVPHAAR
jgi:apolipoprotein D and lipocalin family protein